jgi:ATP-binding cassette subfamily B protein
LSDIPLLRDLDHEAQRALTERLRCERFEAGEDIVRQGDAGDKLYLILRGQADVLAADERGEHRINSLSAGDYFGEMALFSESPRVATVRAAAPTEVYSLARVDFASLLDQQPRLRVALEQTVRARRAALATALAERASSSGHNRVHEDE